MQRWMSFIQDNNPDFIRKKKVGPDFADWLAPDPSTPKDLVDTAYWALIANMMSEMAHATGKEEDDKTYSKLYENIRTAFQKAYVRENGEIATGSQTSYVVALQMKLVPEQLEAAAVENLVKNIEAHGSHLTTGFLGTPFLLFCLANHGRTDVAYKLLLNETYPSWGYMLSKGATTWWERWNGDTGDPAMNSYNHYAFGSVVAWIYQCVAGIDTASSGAGFHEIIIHPRLDARITAGSRRIRFHVRQNHHRLEWFAIWSIRTEGEHSSEHDGKDNTARHWESYADARWETRPLRKGSGRPNGSDRIGHLRISIEVTPGNPPRKKATRERMEPEAPAAQQPHGLRTHACPQSRFAMVSAKAEFIRYLVSVYAR